MSAYHHILQRQINKYLRDDSKICKNLHHFFQVISNTYEHYEKNRQLLERSMNLSSKELFDSNEELSKAYKRQEIVLDELKEAIAELTLNEVPGLEGDRNGDNLLIMVDLLRKKIRIKKEFEEELTASKRGLQAANQELEQIAYITSHDLKSPLRSIGSIASWIKSDHEELLDEVSKEQIDILIGRVNRLYNLIDGISHYMNLNTLEEDQREIIDLNQIIKNTEEALKIPQNIDLIIKKPLPKIVAIKAHLNLIFNQLIKNAVLFMDKEKGQIVIDHKKNSQGITFTVSDNGPGIHKKYYRKIFKIFQTLNSRDDLETNGIGLAMVKKIVKMYGGSITVHSCRGKGSTFKFNLENIK